MGQNEGDQKGNAPNGIPPPKIYDAHGRAIERKPEKDDSSRSRDQPRPSWWAGLGRGEKIALAVGLPMLTVAIIAVAVAWHYGIIAHKDALDAVVPQATVVAQSTEEYRIKHRADVVLDVSGPDDLVAGSNNFTISVRDKGGGDAINVTLVRAPASIVTDYDYLHDPAYRSADELALQNGNNLRPSDPGWIWPIKVVLDQSEIDKINRAALFPGGSTPNIGDFKELLIYATIRYWDGFGCHRVNVCQSYQPKEVCPGPVCRGPMSCERTRVLCNTCRRPIREDAEEPPERCGYSPDGTPVELHEQRYHG